MDEALRLLAVFALVALNAFFVIGEYAVVTARRGAIATRSGRGAAAALRLMDEPVRVISTVQVGITAIGILLGALGEPVVRDLLGESVPGWLGFLIGFATVTYLSVVLGELVPKAVTLQKTETLAVLVARPIELLSVLLRPAVWVLGRSAGVVLRPLGVRNVIAGDTIRSADELRVLVDEAEGAGIIPTAQEELLHNVFDFAGREVRDVMVPAPDVFWLDASSTVEAALARVMDEPFARYPVADGSLAQVRGVVHFRELVTAARDGTPATVGELAREILVVPGTKDLGALLRELRESRAHLALVADEYGTCVGVVSVEDVLEELVGEIEDEFDLPDATVTELGGGAVQVAGSMTVDDFTEITGIALPAGEAHTIAGVVFDRLGRRPEVGDRVVLDEVVLEVASLEGLRITAVVARPA